MNHNQSTRPAQTYWPLGQLILARLREFYREPEAVFWVYGFPILLVVGLGVAFRNRPIEQISIDVESGPRAAEIVSALSGQERFRPRIVEPEEAQRQLQTGRTDLVVRAGSTVELRYEYEYDPTRAPSLLAHAAVDDALQRAAGRKDVVEVSTKVYEKPGGRYIDFLVPGLLGMSLMGGGLWGIGFVTVDMRIRKLLKRFLATPMRKSDFLAGLMISRLMFLVPEVLVLLVFSWLVFGVVVHGNPLAVVFLILLGAVTFAGIGLLVASRAKTIEAVSGLMNLVMLPMWILSGIFFSSNRFPDAAQPFISVLPLTALNNALRAVMQEGAPLLSQWPEISILSLWGAISFWVAIRLFRWV